MVVSREVIQLVSEEMSMKCTTGRGASGTRGRNSASTSSAREGEIDDADMNGIEFNINDYINDIPSLVDDLTDEEDELESKMSGKNNLGQDIKYVNSFNNESNDTDKPVREVDHTSKEIKQERNQLMMVIIKYVSIKITNLFPPTSSESKISLEKFLIIMINRLKMTLANFLKSIIYLFRYMDIIYLLRYLNQSNNYANSNEMDFPLKKLIVGCFKLTLLKERIHKNWFKMTGLKDNEINIIIQTIMKRLNNKVVIKNNELTKFKCEIFRYVKMVSQEV